MLAQTQRGLGATPHAPASAASSAAQQGGRRCGRDVSTTLPRAGRAARRAPRRQRRRAGCCRWGWWTTTRTARSSCAPGGWARTAWALRATSAWPDNGAQLGTMCRIVHRKRAKRFRLPRALAVRHSSKRSARRRSRPGQRVVTAAWVLTVAAGVSVHACGRLPAQVRAAVAAVAGPACALAGRCGRAAPAALLRARRRCAQGPAGVAAGCHCRRRP